ncbi:anti-sigma factor domain-containing protein [Ferruginibacter yonginensis]|uniref:Anti-sigma factor domain-containing protein n=1 Tax=Ferruginibacter yonginensis TaxID=1310416 RepID=A0ABV8QVZ9_9BACT
MEKQEIITSGLLELYAAGATTPEETAQVQRWCVEYPEVQAELHQIEQSLEAYAFANAVTPSVSVKDSIFASINNIAANTNNTDATYANETAKVVSINNSPFKKYAAAAAVILLIGSSILNYNYYNKLNDANKKLAEGEQQLASLNEQLTAASKDMSIVHSKYSEPVALNGLEVAPDAAAKVFWMKNTGEVYVDVTNLPAVPAGKQYQFWGIVDGKPVSGGLITLDNGKKLSIIKMKSFGKVEAFAISLETEGGHEQPEGSIYVMGKL